MFARSSNGLLIHLLTSLCMILILACNQEVGVGSSIENRLQIEVEPAFPNLKFKNLTNLVQPDDQYDLMFVTEQSGLIHAFRVKNLDPRTCGKSLSQYSLLGCAIFTCG